MEATYEVISAVRGIRQGKPDSFKKLFMISLNEMYFQFYFTVANQNVINEELSRFYQSVDKQFSLLEKEGDIVDWMNQIAMNQINDWIATNCKDLLEAEKRGVYEPPVYEDRYLPALEASDLEYTKALMAIINEFPVIFRFIAVAIYFNNYTAEELADMLYVEKSVITKRIDYIKKVLAVRMQDYCAAKKIAKITINTQKIRTAMVELGKLYEYPYAEQLYEVVKLNCKHS